MLIKFTLIALALVSGTNCQGSDPCHTTAHATYGLGYCIEQTQCPNSLYISNLCPSYGVTIKCCYSGNLNCAYASKFTHDLAQAVITRNGISRVSSGGCSNRNNPTCTSLEQVNCRTIAGIVKFKNRVNCPVTITGGTETGHSTSGTQTHWNGYKLDISLSSCYDSKIQSWTYLGVRGDGAPMWKSPDGETLAKEGNHWDIVYP